MALASVEWGDLHSLRHSSSRRLFHQVKGLRLRGWDKTTERRGCPHCASCGPAGGSTFHIVWVCPAAQRLWRMVRSSWSGLGLWAASDFASDRDFLIAVFSLRLPRTRDMACLSQRSPDSSDAPDGPYPALHAAWQHIVLETLIVILGWRRGRSDPVCSWSPAQALVIHDASCLRVLDLLVLLLSRDARVLPLHATLLRELRETFSHTAAPSPPVPPSTAVHILYFDGGSRGNPGPVGSGACVIRVHAHTGDANVVWSAAMSHAHRTTTNNQAEYLGLLTGLRAAHHYKWPALEVVGDSALVLNQLRFYRTPKNTRLRTLYAEAHRLADQLDICRWSHHARATNRMADTLANIAMDTATSSQVVHPTARSDHAAVQAHLSNDLLPWLAANIGNRVEFSFSS